MRALLTGDWHRDWVTGGVPRGAEIERAAHFCVDAAVQAKVDLFVFAGDLCDPDDGAAVTAASAFSIEIALRLLREEIASAWIIGNHDVYEDGTGNTTLTPLARVANGLPKGAPAIHVFEQPDMRRLRVGNGQVPFLALPFTPTSHTYRPDKVVEMFAPQFVGGMVIGHLKVEGVQPGEETTEMPRGRDILFPREELRRLMPHTFLANGHYHRQQIYDGVHIPGSLARLTFGEREHTPGFLIVEVPT